MYWNDEGWEVSRNPVFSSPKKTPAFLLIPSFLCHFKMSRMTRNENNNGEISFQCHSTHFDFISSFKNDDGMTKWGEMKGYFWTKAKPLILKLNSFHCHSIILRPFQFEVNLKLIQCRRYIAFASKNFNMVLSLLKRQQHIKSFRSHFLHSRLIQKRMSSSKIEWQNDWGMRWVSESRVLPWFKNITSFPLIRSFHHHSWMTKWSRIE